MPFQTNSTHRGVGIKQWRLIVRNLNFKTKEEDILQWAKQYGKIVEVRLPKCKDKRYPDSCAGFCFIQFAKRADAEKARNEQNFSQLVERKVAIDWAVDKDSWVTVEQEAKNHLDIVKKLNEDSEKEQIIHQMSRAKKATASMGQFQQTLKGEKAPKGTSLKRKFEPNEGNAAEERKHQMEILKRLESKRPKLAEGRIDAVSMST